MLSTNSYVVCFFFLKSRFFWNEWTFTFKQRRNGYAGPWSTAAHIHNHFKIIINSLSIHNFYFLPSVSPLNKKKTKLHITNRYSIHSFIRCSQNHSSSSLCFFVLRRMLVVLCRSYAPLGISHPTSPVRTSLGTRFTFPLWPQFTWLGHCLLLGA